MEVSQAQAEQVQRDKDGVLRRRMTRVLETRESLGLTGLTGDLAFIVICTEPENQRAAVTELVRFTGYELTDAFEADELRTYVLKCRDSADILVQCRLKGDNPFQSRNCFPKSSHMPNTRLETLVFVCNDMERYWRIQRERGIPFMMDTPIDRGPYRFLQTSPSVYTGNSIGFVQWQDKPGEYRGKGDRPLCLELDDFIIPWKKNIGTLDHVATRVKAAHRDDAILEFMELSDYNFDFAIYVPDLNSITNVARFRGARFAQVFTSGIAEDAAGEAIGPTEMFVKNYGPRVHHMAFLTDAIEAVDAALREDGLAFLSELVGSETMGIKQSFSAPSRYTLLVNEYIKRYGDFDGFFTQQNVTQLTLATAKQ